VPLAELPRPAARLNPVVDIDGEQYVMLTQSMSAVPVKLLKQSVGSLADRYDEIVAAMDLLLQGF
jgi:toxin CcdB